MKSGKYNIVKPFKQTADKVQSLLNDIAVFDKNYEVFKKNAEKYAKIF